MLTQPIRRGVGREGVYGSRVSATSVDVGVAPSDAAGFAEWLRPSWAAMSALARRLDGRGEWEDVLQEALSAAWRKRAQFDGHRGSARNWLLAIVADQAHKNRRRTRHGELADEPSVGVGVASESRLDVESAMRRLSPRQRLAVALHYFLGLSVADTAAVMGCAAGTVKSTLSDARLRLRSELGEDYR